MAAGFHDVDTDFMPDVPSSYHLEPVRLDQVPASAKLLRDVFGGGERLWLERIQHWESNPAMRPDAPRGWTVTAPDGAMVAFMGNAPFTYVGDDGAEFECMAAHSLAVRPEHRGRGLARGLTQTEFAEPCDFSVGVQTSRGGWAATLASGADRMRQEWVRKPRIMVADAGMLMRGLAARVTRRRRQVPLDLTDRGDEGGPIGNGLEVERVSSFRPDNDGDLSAMIARPARVRPRRSAAILNWLYFGSRHLRRTRLVLGLRRHDRLVGYAGFRILPESLVLLEARALRDEPAAVRLLLGAGRQWARQRRMSHVLLHVYSPAVAAALPRFSSLPAVGRARFPYAIAIKNPSLRLAELELGPWDGDAVIADDARLHDPSL